MKRCLSSRQGLWSNQVVPLQGTNDFSGPQLPTYSPYGASLDCRIKLNCPDFQVGEKVSRNKLNSPDFQVGGFLKKEVLTGHVGSRHGSSNRG